MKHQAGQQIYLLFATAVRQRDGKLSLMLLKGSKKKRFELACITHIGKSFGMIAKVDTYRDFFVLSALNTFIFLKVNTGDHPSLEIVCNVDFTSSEPQAPAYSLDFCLDASNLYFLSDSKSVCVKPINDQQSSDARLP